MRFREKEKGKWKNVEKWEKEKKRKISRYCDQFTLNIIDDTHPDIRSLRKCSDFVYHVMFLLAVHIDHYR